MTDDALLRDATRPWTTEEKLHAAIHGPVFRDLLRRDSVVVERDGWFQITTPSSRSVLNEVVLSRVAAEEADRTIEEVVGHYRALGLPVKWCVGPWTELADFGARLEARGFRFWDVRGMVCAAALALTVPSSVVVESVTADNQAEFDATFVSGWDLGADALAAFSLQHREVIERAPRRVLFFLARVDGAPAATTALVLRDGPRPFGYLVGAQVLAAYRGRGIYRALIEARLAALRAEGITLAVTHARESTSAPMLEHLGFETAFRSRCYVLDA